MFLSWEDQDNGFWHVSQLPDCPETSLPSRGLSVPHHLPTQIGLFVQFLLASQSQPVLKWLRVSLHFQIYKFTYLKKVPRKFLYLELAPGRFREEGDVP